MSDLQRDGGPLHAAAVACYAAVLALGVSVDLAGSWTRSSLLPSATATIATLAFAARPWLRSLVPTGRPSSLDAQDRIALAAGGAAVALGLAYLAAGWQSLVVWSHVGGGALAVAFALDEGADPKYDLVGLAAVVVAVVGVYEAVTRGLAARPVVLVVGGVGLFALEQAELRRRPE